MKISVIIPYHDEKRYLNDCLESLEEQTFQDFEVILVKDHCQAELPERKLDLTECETDKTGVAAARNLGLASAKGEYIYFLDCDDYIEKDAFEQFVKTVETDRAEIVWGSIHETWYKRQVYYENGKELDAMNGLSGEDCEETGIVAGEIRTDEKMDTVSVHSAFFRREFLLENEIHFSEEVKFMSDYLFVLKALSIAKQKRGKVAACRKSLYIQRKHNEPVNLTSL